MQKRTKSIKYFSKYIIHVLSCFTDIISNFLFYWNRVGGWVHFYPIYYHRTTHCIVALHVVLCDIATGSVSQYYLRLSQKKVDCDHHDVESNKYLNTCFVLDNHFTSMNCLKSYDEIIRLPPADLIIHTPILYIHIMKSVPLINHFYHHNSVVYH